MKFFYHGSSYEYEPAQIDQNQGLALNQTGNTQPISLKYRGTIYLVEPTKERAASAPQQATHTLSYHGNNYVVNGSAQPDVKGVFPKLALVW